MLTPNEIVEKKFDKVMVWGYDMNAVDSFLESVSADYTQLYKENIALKNKMKVLVSKIEEYRSVDESMRQALLNAKNLAAEMTKNAEAEAEKCRAEAEAYAAKCRAEAEAEAEKCRTEAQTIAETSRAQASADAEASLASYKERIAAEEMRLEEAKTNVQVFIDKSIDLYRKELDALVTMREQELSYEISIPAAPPVSEPVPVSEPIVIEPAPVAEAPAAVEIPVPAVEEPGKAPVEEPASDEELILPDTITLPDLPPIPTAKPAQPKAEKPRTNVYEVDTEDDIPKHPKRRIDAVAAARRAAASHQSVREEDNEETIVLTPKPRFEFDNLQFGDKYNAADRKKHK